MQKSQKQAHQSHALKDAYVDGVKNATREGRLNPSIAQQPVVLQASGHINLDTGMRGGVNDNDPSLYIHRGGETQRYHDPSMANPIDGGPGESRMGPLDHQHQQLLPQMQQEFDQRQRGINMHRIFGQNPNEIAQNELRDPMTIKSVIG